MFLALKMFVLEGQDLNTGPGCLFLLQDELLPSRMTYLFCPVVVVEYSLMPGFLLQSKGFSLFSSLGSWVNVSVLE